MNERPPITFEKLGEVPRDQVHKDSRRILRHESGPGLDILGQQLSRMFYLEDLDEQIESEKITDFDQAREIIAKSFARLKSYGIVFDFDMSQDAATEGMRAHEVLVMTATEITPTEVSPEDEGVLVEFTSKSLDLVENLYSYLQDTLAHTNEPVLWDASNFKQYVYGTTAGSDESRFYLVDLDPRLSREAIWIRSALSGLIGMLEKIKWQYSTSTNRAPLSDPLEDRLQVLENTIRDDLDNRVLASQQSKKNREDQTRLL